MENATDFNGFHIGADEEKTDVADAKTELFPAPERFNVAFAVFREAVQA